mgnify:CR=1 FL=1
MRGLALRSPSLKNKPLALLWLRDDLRLADHPALAAALQKGYAVLPLYIDEPPSPESRAMGAASKVWLHHALSALQESLQERGSTLLIKRGDALKILNQQIEQTGATALYWSRRYGAQERATDMQIKNFAKEQGLDVESFNAHLLVEPWHVTTKTGQPMKVFTPFWRAARALGEPSPPLPAPKKIPLPDLDFEALKSLSITQLRLLPTKPDWASPMLAHWTISEKGAQKRLGHFLENGLKGYAEDRNRPDLDHVSRLSPYLRFGMISPRQVWHAAVAACADGRSNASDKDLSTFQSELGWREFSYHLLYHNPNLAHKNYQSRFDAFPWQDNERLVKAWQKGLTGYPIVDAGMRELWQTGFMHNRVRMIAASFLIKHLMTDWRIGENWFWDTLFDADPASNPASWQWVAGSGADAAPYFRIFNPILQGERFDPKGAYIRRYIPELAALPDDLIHKPWTAPQGLLAQFKIKLGQDYPLPLIDHGEGRDRALAAFKSLNE